MPLPSSSSSPVFSHSEESSMHPDDRMYEEARKKDLLSGFSRSRQRDQDSQEKGEKERQEEEEEGNDFLRVMRRVHHSQRYEDEEKKSKSLSSPLHQKLVSLLDLSLSSCSLSLSAFFSSKIDRQGGRSKNRR